MLETMPQRAFRSAARRLPWLNEARTSLVRYLADLDGSKAPPPNAPPVGPPRPAPPPEPEPHLEGTGERQVGKTVDAIESRHRLRYYFASAYLDCLPAFYEASVRFADVGCGVGYGSWIVATTAAEKVKQIDAFDISADAIRFARRFYADDRIAYHEQDCSAPALTNHPAFAGVSFDVVTCFEFLEHIEVADSCALLDLLLDRSKVLITSFPIDNASVFHKIRFTSEQVEDYYQQGIKRARRPKKLTQRLVQDGRYALYVVEDE